jgi:hypothetical protein
MIMDFVTGRLKGEAFVKFATMDDAFRALNKHKEKLGPRFVCLKLLFLNNFVNLFYTS